MSNYTQFYTSADVSVFMEDSAGTGSQQDEPQVMIDTALSVGWSETLSSFGVYGIGEQRFGFLSKGNLMVQGALEISFTHDEYIKTIIDSVKSGPMADLASEEDLVNLLEDSSFADMQTGQYRLKKRLFDKLNTSLSATAPGTGIQDLQSGWDLRVVFNNSNHHHLDENKQFLIKDCTIVGSTIQVATGSSGQISQIYSFVAREVKSGSVNN